MLENNEPFWSPSDGFIKSNRSQSTQGFDGNSVGNIFFFFFFFDERAKSADALKMVHSNIKKKPKSSVID